jgi:hypothetical protein
MRTRTWIGLRGGASVPMVAMIGGVGLVDLEYTIPDKQPIVIVLLAFLPD